jgi:uncharacterized protein (DUF2345 family)
MRVLYAVCLLFVVVGCGGSYITLDNADAVEFTKVGDWVALKGEGKYRHGDITTLSTTVPNVGTLLVRCHPATDKQGENLTVRGKVRQIMRDRGIVLIDLEQCSYSGGW